MPSEQPYAGANSLSSGTLYVGYPGSIGSYILSGSGLLSGAISEFVGYSCTRGFTQSGGTNSVSGTLILAQFASSIGTYNLNGGLLSLAGITAGSGAAALNFDGGTLGAAIRLSSSVNMTLTSSGGNATVDTTGGSIALSGNLSGPGGLTKFGAGTLLLSGTNTYGGGTDVLAGTLIVNSDKALLSGTNLEVGAAAESVFGTAAESRGITVPEPSTAGLLLASAMALLMRSKKWLKVICRQARTCLGPAFAARGVQSPIPAPAWLRATFTRRAPARGRDQGGRRSCRRRQA